MTQTKDARIKAEMRRLAAFDFRAIYGALPSPPRRRVEQLRRELRVARAALRRAEAVMCIVQPRSNTREYLEALQAVRKALK